MKNITNVFKEKFKSKQSSNEESSFFISLRDFTEYCKAHSLLILFTILILALAHGGNIFYNNMGIDTQMFIEIPTFEYNWLGIGRFGLLIEKFVLGLTSFCPYYAGVIFFTFLIFSNIILYYTFYKISNKDFGLINLCIPLIAFTHPIFVEQFVYMLQYAEIASAIFLTSLATLFIFTWLKNKKIIYSILGIVCLIISFASYQSFVGLYIAFCIFGFILSFENEEKLKSSFLTIVKLIITFLIALVGYKVITKILPSNTAYIDDSFFWGSYPLRSIYEFVIGHVKDVVKGRGNYYNLGYTIGAILTVLILIYKLVKDKKQTKVSNKIWYSLSILAFIGTPFYMVLAIGHAPLIRAQLILPFTEALLFMFIAYYLNQSKWFKFLIFVIVIYIAETQMFMTQTLYYTDKMRNEFDTQIAYQIINDMQKAGVKEMDSIAIIGHKEAKLNSVCKTGETVGLSLFSVNYNALPYYFHSSSIILRLFNCLGYKYNLCIPEQITEARNIAKEMPVWPEEGSIKSYNNYVIVKLSEDDLPLE